MVQVQFSSASESVHTEIFLFYSARACVSSNFDEGVWVPPEPRTELHSIVVHFSSASELVLELNSGNTSAVTLPQSGTVLGADSGVWSNLELGTEWS